MFPPVPPNQAARLEALRRYGILDTPPEPEFDEITDLVARVCEAPIAVINFVDDERQWFKSEIGLGVRETPLDVSICAHAILQRDLFVVGDTLLDDRFKNNPLVRGDPRLRFYAGALLETQDRHPLGTLCVLDYKPRALTELQSAALRTLARQVMTQLELRRANAALTAGIIESDSGREKAEDALRQARKMETVGHLTSGIAHDFNNLLTVILGNLEGVERRLAGADATVAKRVATAIRGTERAATLSHRLLAFSRPRGMAPGPIDPGAVIAGMLDLLSRTLGAQVTIVTSLADALWPVRADENQLENAILNLAINARDAMPDGGTLTIGAMNMTVDESLIETEIELNPGQYVLLSVTDTGTGMAPEIVQRMFDPFFTTKGVDGTGLGLGMVYGFVKQAQGHVRVQSEVGKGTSVRLYLPRSPGEG